MEYEEDFDVDFSDLDEREYTMDDIDEFPHVKEFLESLAQEEKDKQMKEQNLQAFQTFATDVTRNKQRVKCIFPSYVNVKRETEFDLEMYLNYFKYSSCPPNPPLKMEDHTSDKTPQNVLRNKTP